MMTIYLPKTSDNDFQHLNLALHIVLLVYKCYVTDRIYFSTGPLLFMWQYKREMRYARSIAFALNFIASLHYKQIISSIYAVKIRHFQCRIFRNVVLPLPHSQKLCGYMIPYFCYSKRKILAVDTVVISKNPCNFCPACCGVLGHYTASFECLRKLFITQKCRNKLKSEVALDYALSQCCFKPFTLEKRQRVLSLLIQKFYFSDLNIQNCTEYGYWLKLTRISYT